jgi:hypothetical protein
MYERNRGRRNNHQDEDRHGESFGGQRPPLQWREEEMIQRGSAVGVINSAQRSDGTKIHSWSLGKAGRRDGKVLKFLDRRDIDDAQAVLVDVKEWIDEDRAAERGP